MPSSYVGLLRTRKPHQHSRVTSVELFFDLVFVFAVTRLSHSLLEHLTLLGALQTLMLMMAVWWVWIYTTWITNWLDPERISVRVMLFVLMVAGLILSGAVPGAFHQTGLVFAGAYVFMQVGRTLFMLWAVRGKARLARAFLRIACWLVASAVLWVAGGLAHDAGRMILWTGALVIELFAPAAAYWVPGLGRTPTGDWNVEGGHMAERCGLFVIIALGESILVTGATFADLPISPTTAAAFLAAVVGSIAMWGIYFDAAAEAAMARIAASDDPGRLARSAYTYIHLPIVAGIIVSAVADEMVLSHPGGRVGAPMAAVILGGPALYLLGAVLFKWCVWSVVSHRRLAGLAALAALIPAAGLTTPLGYAAAATAVLVAVAAWETVALRRETAKVEVSGPAGGERLRGSERYRPGPHR
jgi:low temperature requirement protein LtrA